MGTVFLGKCGVSKSLALGPLLFLIYINGLSDGLSFTCKNFADDTFFFVHDKHLSRDELTNNLKKKK